MNINIHIFFQCNCWLALLLSLPYRRITSCLEEMRGALSIGGSYTLFNITKTCSTVALNITIQSSWRQSRRCWWNSTILWKCFHRFPLFFLSYIRLSLIQKCQKHLLYVVLLNLRNDCQFETLDGWLFVPKCHVSSCILKKKDDDASE